MVEVLNTYWEFNKGYLEIRPKNLLIFFYEKYHEIGHWELNKDLIKFSFFEVKYECVLTKDEIKGEGKSCKKTGKELQERVIPFLAKRADNLTSKMLFELPFSKWTIKSNSNPNLIFKYKFENYGLIKISNYSWDYFDESGSWFINNNKLCFPMNYYVNLIGTFEELEIKGEAKNEKGVVWNFSADKAGYYPRFRGDYLYKRNLFPEAIQFYEQYFKLEQAFFEFDISLSFSNYLESILKIENPEVNIDENNINYQHIKAQLKKNWEEKTDKLNNRTEKELFSPLIYQPNFILRYGKHQGRSLLDIINLDPNYIIWCIKNLPNFSIYKSGILNENLRNCEGFLLALEFHLIKHLMRDEIIRRELAEEEYERRMESSSYSFDDAYYDGGGGNEWSDPTLFY